MRQFGQRCWRIPEISTWYEQTLNEVVDRLLLPIFLFSSYPFFIVIQVFTIHFPSVCDLCSFSQIFASGWLDTLQRWLELSSHWFDHLEGLPGISFWVRCFRFHAHAFCCCSLSLWAFSVIQPSVLDIGFYLCLLLPSFPWLLQKSHQISIYFYFATNVFVILEQKCMLAAPRAAPW